MKGACPQASVYLHIPFCFGKCDYCDFYSISVDPDDPRLSLYVDALIRDAASQLAAFGVREVPTLYIGGGTPSVLGTAAIARLLDALAALLPPGEREFTVEANPESVDRPFLEACRAGGVNRISLGLQSFHDASRRLVNRRGSGADAMEALALSSALFPGSVSADLLSGLPGQDEAQLLRDIDALLAQHPAHVSLYALTLEDGTPLASRVPALGSLLPQGEEADALWLAGAQALEAEGYERYEVSNFAQGEKRSQHNTRYWRMENWLGVGAGASGTVIDDHSGRGLRISVAQDIAAYLENPELDSQTVSACLDSPELEGRFDSSPSVHAIEELDAATLLKETCLMGFRYIEGPDLALVQKRFHRDLGDCIPLSLAKWRRRGFLREDACALTKEGLLFLNPFLLDVFSELDGYAI